MQHFAHVVEQGHIAVPFFRFLHQGFQLDIGILQGLLCLAALGDVDIGAPVSQEVALVIEHGNAAGG